MGEQLREGRTSGPHSGQPDGDPLMASRRPIIAGNWKLNLGPGAASALATLLADEYGGGVAAELVVFPTALSLHGVVSALVNPNHTPVAVGVQEIAAVDSGAMTGANSAVMAAEAGCTWALIGHSERRQHFGETDGGVRAKVDAALGAHLKAMVCVGETLEERDAGRTLDVVARQVRAGLDGLPPSQLRHVALAYEPVWAIGTGRTATAAQAQQVHGAIRQGLTQQFSASVAAEMRILYGGSVKPANAAELMACADIDGALVGGASLRLSTYAGIVAAV